MYHHCIFLAKQTARPPKRVVPLALNPLTRWSRTLPAWDARLSNRPHLDQLSVSFEGCHSAFNATNAIRTCLFFGTCETPTFLTLDSWRSIARAQAREGVAAARKSTHSDADIDATSTPEQSVDDVVASGEKDSQWAAVAQFGDAAFLRGPNSGMPIVALENFSPRAESVFKRRFPHRARLLVGHENLGVSPKYLDGDEKLATTASDVVYIPQYGTISSLNVIASTGIALFYAFLDEHFPASRSLAENPSNNTHTLWQELVVSKPEVGTALHQYQATFQAKLPIGESTEMHVAEKALADPQGNRTPRLDPRPLHPSYFSKDVAEIRVAHTAFREALLVYSNAHSHASSSGERAQPRTRFGLSVLYENDYDTRNFGGLIRNANAFLVDAVCYLGRRHVNRVGAVGSYHYTPPMYLGPTFEDSDDVDESRSADDDARDEGNDAAAAAKRAAREAMIRRVVTEQSANARGGNQLSMQQERIIRLSLWSLDMRSRIEKACGGRARFWLLDCGHRSLYAEDFDMLRQRQKDGLAADLQSQRFRSSLESLTWYLSHCGEEDFGLSLCDDEVTLADAARDGVVLVVPQEGKLPHISILMQCEKILTVLPDSVESATEGGNVAVTRGLPSQVASAIALQRLSAILHPALRSL